MTTPDTRTIPRAKVIEALVVLGIDPDEFERVVISADSLFIVGRGRIPRGGFRPIPTRETVMVVDDRPSFAQLRYGRKVKDQPQA